MAQLYNCTIAKLVHYKDVISFGEDGRWRIRPEGTIYTIAPATSISYDSNQSDSDAGKVEEQNVTISVETRYLLTGLNCALKYFIVELPDGHGGYKYIGSVDYPATVTINQDKMYSTLNITADNVF